MLNPPGLTSGDLFLQDSNGSISDLIRFNPSENGGSLVFYSADNLGALADVTLPTLFYQNSSLCPKAREPSPIPPLRVNPVL